MCHPCKLASRGKQIIPALLTVISTIAFVPVLSFLTTSPSCLCTSARFLFLYITPGLFSLSSFLLRDLRVPLSFRSAMTTVPPPNAQGLRAEKLTSLPSLACSLSSLPQATSMDCVSLHPNMYAQRAAESEAKVTLSRLLPWYGLLMPNAPSSSLSGMVCTSPAQKGPVKDRCITTARPTPTSLPWLHEPSTYTSCFSLMARG